MIPLNIIGRTFFGDRLLPFRPSEKRSKTLRAATLTVGLLKKAPTENYSITFDIKT